MKTFFRRFVEDFEILNIKSFIRKYNNNITEMSNIKKVDEIVCKKLYTELKWKIQSIPIT